MLSQFRGPGASPSHESNASALYSGYSDAQLVQLCRLYWLDFEVFGFAWPPACTVVAANRAS